MRAKTSERLVRDMDRYRHDLISGWDLEDRSQLFTTLILQLLVKLKKKEQFDN